ncbi:MAG: Phosphotransferase enzyme family protein [Streptosporangiaceae bacterium]|nr:Phosphotransferase enzyme family protein [Streptosporangiaceae bacterium]
MRTDWTELPGELRDAVEDRTGLIGDVVPAATGNHADVASTLHTSSGRTFVKAARKVSPEHDGPEVRSLRWEAAISPHVSEYAPRLLWEVEAGGWLALGFEHVEGRHAGYSPGSPDLSLLIKTVEAFQAMKCPDVVTMRVERRWESVAAEVTPMAGNALLHTDVNCSNMLITPDGRPYVVDWAFTSRGAAWVELGLLIPWLLKAGHSPPQAAEWVAQFPAWTAADPAAIDLFSEVSAERWTRHSAANPATWVAEHAALTRQWADYRRG